MSYYYISVIKLQLVKRQRIKVTSQELKEVKDQYVLFYKIAPILVMYTLVIILIWPYLLIMLAKY
jgi:hypothetical protein